MLKPEIGLPIFLSFAHKSPDFALEMQREFSRMGLLVTSVLPRFNQYLGAEIIGNTSQMIVLQSTEETKESIARDYRDALYTGEVRRTIRAYECKRCSLVTEVGFQMQWQTIEQLKRRAARAAIMTPSSLFKKERITTQNGVIARCRLDRSSRMILRLSLNLKRTFPLSHSEMKRLPILAFISESWKRRFTMKKRNVCAGS